MALLYHQSHQRRYRQQSAGVQLFHGGVINANFITGLSGPAALTRDSSGNLYVANDGSRMINKYDATGTIINTFSLPNVSDQRGMVVDGNNHLFIGNSLNNSTEGEYDAITGAAIHDNLIVSGNQAFGLALDGNDLFVSYNGSNVVEEYNATTGAVINPNFVSLDNEFLGPTGMVVESSRANPVPGPNNWILITTAGMTLCAWQCRRKKATTRPMLEHP